MREIRFRGVKEDGVWAYGHYAKKPIQCDVIIDSMGFEYDVAQSTVGQFTGLKDRNGVEIYEGDVVSEGHGSLSGIVQWHEKATGFCYKTDTATIGLYGFCGEVIGNIHETNSPGGSE